MSNNIVVGLGEILWDVYPERKVLGGAPANFAYHISQFGYDGYAVSAVGNDQLGKEVLFALSEKELNYIIETVEFPTGTVNVQLNDVGIPQYEICENTAWDNIPFTEKSENLAKNSRAVCFGSLAQRNVVSREMIAKFLNAMPDDSLKIFDINLRQNFYNKQLIHESLSIANILKINDDEVVQVSRLFGWGGKNEGEVCKCLLDLYNLDIVILTRGTKGSFVFTFESTSYRPVPKVEVIDTVGAGDSFTAAFIASYMDGNSISEAHKLAVEVSAQVCTQYGAMPDLSNVFNKLIIN